jgi:hypothetical protein
LLQDSAKWIQDGKKKMKHFTIEAPFLAALVVLDRTELALAESILESRLPLSSLFVVLTC